MSFLNTLKGIFGTKKNKPVAKAKRPVAKKAPLKKIVAVAAKPAAAKK